MTSFISCGPDLLAPKTGLFSTDGFYNGMVYKVFYKDSSRRDLAASIDSVVWEFAASLSDADEKSILSRVNNNDSSVILTEPLIRAFRNMKVLDSLTGGYLKMNCSDLKVRWGLNGKKLKTGWREPSQQELDSFLKLMADEETELFRLENKTRKVGEEQRDADQKYWLENIRVKKNSDMDLSALLRGSLVDMIAEYLELEGIENYSVQVDQVIRTSGTWRNKGWKVGIERPDLSEPIRPQGGIILKNEAMATSGFTRNAISTPMGDFLPLLNPKTGKPVECGFFSFTVIAEDATTADALSNAFLTMGKDSALAFAKRKKIELFYLERGEDENFISENTFLNSRKILPADSIRFMGF